MTAPIHELTDGWRQSGIEPGDVVLVHMSCKRTFQRYAERGRHITPQVILQSFLDAVGPKGTMVFPTFNFGFCDGEPYDIRKTPSKMGVVTELARRDPRAVRNGHPVYSVAAIGKQADAFNVDNYRGLGEGSVFDILRKMGGKVASLDLTDQYGMTIHHHIEAMLKAPHRFEKEFTAPYTGWDGKTELRTYAIYVRRRSLGVQTNVDPMMEQLWAGEVYTGCRPGIKSGLRVADAQTMYDFVKMYIESGKGEGLMYYIDPGTVEDD